MGGHFPGSPLLSLATELPTERNCRTLDDAVMGRLQKHALLDLLLDRYLGQFPQKFLFSLLTGVTCGIHAQAPFDSRHSLDHSSCHSLTNNPMFLLLTYLPTQIPPKS
jgi:hypothetical protein